MSTTVVTRRIPPAFVMAGGLGLAALGFGMLTQVEGGSGLGLVVSGVVVYSLGLAPVFALTTDLIVGAAPPERAGAAAAISETGSEFGGALGIAILGSVGTALYRSVMAGSVLAGVAPESRDAARATLGGAVAVARQLPDRVGAELLGAAREAFTEALQLTAGLSATIVAAGAIAAVMFLRRTRPDAEDAESGRQADSKPDEAIIGETL